MNDETIEMYKNIMGAKDATRVLPIFQKRGILKTHPIICSRVTFWSHFFSPQDEWIRVCDIIGPGGKKRRRKNVSFSQKIKKFQLESEIFNLGPGSVAEFAKVFEFLQYEKFVSKMKNKRMEGYI